MNFICPRVIRANRGDLASRLGILSAMNDYGIKNIDVFCLHDEDISPLDYPTFRYGKLYNLIPTIKGLKSLLRGHIVLWTGGLDLQDDSSLLKLVFTWIQFTFYRLLGLKIYCISQGAGPIQTKTGKILTRMILNKISLFIARDQGSAALLKSINSKAKIITAFDGIFLGKLNHFAANPIEQNYINSLTHKANGQILIGYNIRQWFHFSSGILPYQLVKNTYRKRSKDKMDELVTRSTEVISKLISENNAKVLLISMYEPDVEPWEDELEYLKLIKRNFANNDNVLLLEKKMSLTGFNELVSKLDLMVGMRLHSTLIAMRAGIPAININYTLKGKDIFKDMGLETNIIELDDFMKDSSLLHRKIIDSLNDPSIKGMLRDKTDNLVKINNDILSKVFEPIINS